MSSPEFAEWMAYERLEPFGPLADEFRQGQVCATVANVQRRPESPPFSAEDFMPALKTALKPIKKPSEQVLTDDQHAALMDAALFGVAKANK